MAKMATSQSPMNSSQFTQQQNRRSQVQPQPQVVWESGPRRIKDMIESKPMVSSIMITPLDEQQQPKSQDKRKGSPPLTGPARKDFDFKKRSMMVGQPHEPGMKRSAYEMGHSALNQPIISEEDELASPPHQRERRRGQP